MRTIAQVSLKIKPVDIFHEQIKSRWKTGKSKLTVMSSPGQDSLAKGRYPNDYPLLRFSPSRPISKQDSDGKASIRLMVLMTGGIIPHSFAVRVVRKCCEERYMDQHDQLITFAVASALGVFFLTLAVRVRVSAIVILLLGGILVGPEFLGLIDPDHLGSGLGTIISLAVGLILFEGGLTLDLKGYRQVSKEIWGVLTTGVLITWLATTLVIKLIFDFEWVFCFLPASLLVFFRARFTSKYLLDSCSSDLTFSCSFCT